MQSLIINSSMQSLMINILFVIELVSPAGYASKGSHGHAERDRFTTPSNWNIFKTQIQSHYGHKAGEWEAISAQMDVNRASLQLTENDNGFVEAEVDKNGFATSFNVEKYKKQALQKMKSSRFNGLPQKLCFDEMFAVILYCNENPAYKDLRVSERQGNYQKWKYFGASLKSAIFKLGKDPAARKPEYLYHGMNKVGFNPIPDIRDRFGAHHRMQRLDTFTSFSARRDVAITFAKDDGVLFQYSFAESMKGGAQFQVDWGMADVSWISPFGEEAEWLFCRGFGVTPFAFERRGELQVVSMRSGKSGW
eukprot:242834_1